MSSRNLLTDDIWEHVPLSLSVVVTALVFVAAVIVLTLAGCGDTPCGCPFGTVCQPSWDKPQGYVCVTAPRLAAGEPSEDAVSDGDVDFLK